MLPHCPQVIFTRFVTRATLRKLESYDHSASVSASARTIGFDAGVQSSFALSRSQGNEQKEESAGSEVNVMGGQIRGDVNTIEGFAAWAQTVRMFPMPIKYELAPFSLMAEPIMEVPQAVLDEPC